MAAATASISGNIFKKISPKKKKEPLESGPFPTRIRLLKYDLHHTAHIRHGGSASIIFGHIGYHHFGGDQ